MAETNKPSNLRAAFSLAGRRALVTGSARGIGRGLALALAEFGATVAVHGVKPSEPLDATLADVRALSPDSVAVTGDLAAPGMAAEIVAAATRLIGAPDIVVANASVQLRRPWREVSEEEALVQMQVNFHATLQLFQAAAPEMAKRRWGRLVSVGSVQEQRPHPDMIVYAASKSALENLVRNLAKQVGPDGITVNNLCPGVFATDRNAEALANPAYAEQVRQRIPVRDFAEPQDAAGAALLLCSDAGRYITGTTICVDGGMGIA
jgi:NAD(P)-dependent dehydrogenase (short-subunit alcohol dehydrogenase family)